MQRKPLLPILRWLLPRPQMGAARQQAAVQVCCRLAAALHSRKSQPRGRWPSGFCGAGLHADGAAKNGKATPRWLVRLPPLLLTLCTRRACWTAACIRCLVPCGPLLLPLKSKLESSSLAFAAGAAAALVPRRLLPLLLLLLGRLPVTSASL